MHEYIVKEAARAAIAYWEKRGRKLYRESITNANGQKDYFEGYLRGIEAAYDAIESVPTVDVVRVVKVKRIRKIRRIQE